MASQDLLFRFLGVDAGAGHQFDRMAGKAIGTEQALKRVAAATVAVGAVIAAWSVKEAAGFQTEMTKIQTQAGATAGEVQRMGKAMLSLAGPTATAPEELAKGLFHLESAGLHGARAVNAMRVAAEGAKLGGANLEDVTNALNAAISSGIPGVKNMSQAMGYLNATVGEGDMRMQDLADALGTGVLAIVKGFGVSMRDASAALAVFGDNNIRGAAAGTSLRVAVQSMIKPTKEGTDILQAMGLQADSMAKALQHGGLNEALHLLKSRMDASGVSGKQVGQVITEAFGRKSSAALSILIGQMGRWDQKFTQSHQAAKGFASSWTGYTKTFQYSFDRMRASVEAMAVKLGTVLLPAVTALANFISGSVVPALSAFGHFLRANAAIVKPLAAIIGTAAAAWFIYSKAAKVAAASMVLFDVAADANPIGVIVVGLAAAAAAFIYLEKTSSKFRHAIALLATIWGKWVQLQLIEIKAVADAFLALVGTLVHGAAAAFGWVPGVGGKLKGAASAFDAFRTHVDGSLSGLANDAGNLGSLAGSMFANNFQAGVNSAFTNAQGGGTGKNSPFRDPGHPGYVPPQAGQSTADGIIGGINKNASKMSDALTKALTGGPSASTGTKTGQSIASHVDKVLQAHMAKFKSDLSNARQFESSIRSGLAGFAGLSGNTGGTDLLGATGAPQSTQSYLRTKARSLEKFVHLLRRLDEKGLSTGLLKQFADIGPDAIPAMQQLLQSGHKGIRTADRLERQVERYAGQAAAMVTRDKYGSQLHTDLEKLPEKIARRLAHELRALNIVTDTGHQDRKQGHRVRTH